MEPEPEKEEEAGALESSGADETYATRQAHALAEYFKNTVDVDKNLRDISDDSNYSFCITLFFMLEDIDNFS